MVDFLNELVLLRIVLECFQCRYEIKIVKSKDFFIDGLKLQFQSFFFYFALKENKIFN